jgi:integrase
MKEPMMMTKRSVPPEPRRGRGRHVPGLFKRGRVYWVKYYQNGRAVRESTGTDKETEAKRFLEGRKGRVATGQPILPRADRVLCGELLDDLRLHYQTTGCRNLDEADGRFLHLKPAFTSVRAAKLSQADATQYAATRQAAAASNASINRELAVLIRALRLGYETGKVLRVPVIRKLKEAGPRQGFFERDQYLTVRKDLPPDLQVAVSISYAFGWRMQSEVLTLERRQWDVEAGTLRLEPGMTKNDEGRVVYLPPDLKAALVAHVERVRALERKLGRVIPYLFPHFRGPWKGTQRRDFRKAWATACTKAGVGGRLRHDLRRTAVRNMVNAGVPERVAMKVTGHRTRAVFDRYSIVSPGDLQEVARRLTGTTGTI